jgi:hypothetical protein
MKAHQDQYRVDVSGSDIALFTSQWPGANLVGLEGVCFGYDKNGDLVDIVYDNGDSDQWDGSALVALSEDAGLYLAGAGDAAIRTELRKDFRERGFPWWWPNWWRR